MKIIKKIIGKFIYGIAKVISVILDGLINLIETMVVYVGGFFKGCFTLVSMGGCLFFLLFINLGLRILANPIALTTIFLLLAFLMFAGRLVSYLKYIKYITAEFLFNTANYLSDSKRYQFKAFDEYKKDYRRAQEEKFREQQRRYYEQQRQWEEQFKQQWYQQNHQGSYGGYGHQSYGNPNVDFKSKYERSCDVLGVSYSTDKDEIKRAYRKKAKEYHPDLNRHPDATKIFQDITAAYEFLNDSNIQRYKSL